MMMIYIFLVMVEFHLLKLIIIIIIIVCLVSRSVDHGLKELSIGQNLPTLITSSHFIGKSHNELVCISLVIWLCNVNDDIL